MLTQEADKLISTGSINFVCQQEKNLLEQGSVFVDMNGILHDPLSGEWADGDGSCDDGDVEPAIKTLLICCLTNFLLGLI